MILVVLEGDEHLKKISLELLGAARELGGGVVALAIGPGAAQLAREAGTFGAERALYVDTPEVASYTALAHTRVLVQTIAATGADLVLLGATSQGRDLAPRLAARLSTGLASDVVSLEVQDGYVARRPIYAGKAFADVKITGKPALATIRPNAFRRAEPTEKGADPEELEVVFEAGDTRGHVTSLESGGRGRVELTEADTVVSGGRGMKGPENFSLIEDLAKVLGGAVGASRAVVDAGWRPHSEQVGQTGKTVSPSLYIACGISGAVQHLAGMSSSKLIVAVNKDADAPIFQIADYGVVGDALEVVPALIQEIEALKS